MNCTINGTTKRYGANPKCFYDSFSVGTDDKYQFGCEFEFYADTKIHDYNTVVDEIVKEIYEFTDVDILVDTIGLPADSDKNDCIQIKPDISLQEHGIEISVPITTQAGIKHFIQMICPIIDKYGCTNKETGFHLHISTVDSDGINFNFYKYMLLCDKAGLLSSWEPRVGYSQNVMDILSSNLKHISRKIKTKKGAIWNIEKIEPNHVEIKSIGGNNYHTEIEKITDEFLAYSECFEKALSKDTEQDKQMYKEHKEQVEKLSIEHSSQFVTALSEAGIL